MTLRADSYSSLDEVMALTRHLLDGYSSFNDRTRPTAVELEKFIDRASGLLNTALAGEGIAVPVSNTTAKLACDDWVTMRAAEYVELTQRGTGYSDGEGSRTASLRNLSGMAAAWASEMRLGFLRLGVTQSAGLSQGLQFTALDAQGERSDPDDGDLEQPLFRRRLYDAGSEGDE